jgi:hypothetical protein
MGMSVFKKVARSVGISRWPFRKRQSVREIMEMIDKHLVKLAGSLAPVSLLSAVFLQSHPRMFTEHQTLYITLSSPASC